MHRHCQRRGGIEGRGAFRHVLLSPPRLGEAAAQSAAAATARLPADAAERLAAQSLARHSAILPPL